MLAERQVSLFKEKKRTLTKPREVVGSNAFNLERLPEFTDAEVKDEIVSYLGEYRLSVPKFSYDLALTGVNRIDRKLRDPHRGEPMTDKAELAIQERTMRGDPTHREVAELKGLKYLEDQLRFVKEGGTVLWVSPPGPKDQGYGDYGFLYVGRVREDRVQMSAVRIENPKLTQFNHVLEALTRREVKNESAEDFLSRPEVVVNTLTEQEIDRALKKHFKFEEDKKKTGVFKKVIAEIDPLLDSFVQIVRFGTKEEKIKAFHAIENYTLKLRKEYEEEEQGNNVIYLTQKKTHLTDIIETYGNKKPPVAYGSCGSTGGSGSQRSNNLISAGSGEVINSAFGSDSHGSREFNCPACGGRNIRPMNTLLKECQKCGSDKVAC